MTRTKILLADDDPDVLDYYRLCLAEHFDLVLARDGIEALKMFEAERPAVVVTDLNMPGVNGTVLTDKIRAHPTLATTPVIIITGTTRNSDLPPGFWKMGTQADAFYEKPIKPDALVQAIRAQLLRRAQGRELPPGKGSYDVKE